MPKASLKATPKTRKKIRPKSRAKIKSKSRSKTKRKSAKNNAPVKKAYISLGLCWGFALLPIPIVSYIGMMIGLVFAVIYSIICITRDEVIKGGLVLAGASAGTGIVYLLGWLIMGLIASKSL